MKKYRWLGLAFGLALMGLSVTPVWADYEAPEVPVTVIDNPVEITNLIKDYWEADFEAPALMSADSDVYYQTKRIVVYMDELPETYHAIEVLYYPEYREYVLQFATEEATAAAYEQLLMLVDDPADCYVDQVLDDSMLEGFTGSLAERQVEMPVVYDGYTSWGAGYTGMEVMKQDKQILATPTQKVAMIDTGADIDSPWFYNHVFSADSFDFGLGTSVITDQKGHGTATASVVASCTGANVELMILKIYNAQGKSSWATVNSAMQYAVAHDASVINLSLGLITSEKKNYVDDIVAVAYEKGIPVCCAAGNDGVDVANCYPANLPQTIAVSAINKNLLFDLNYSDYGQMVDFAAPGTEINCGYLGGRDYMENGTSFSAPMVAAAFTYYKAMNPGASMPELYEYAKSMAVDLGTPGRDIYYGWGAISVCPNKNMTVTAAGADTRSVNLSWSEVADADGYMVYAERAGSYIYVATTTDLQYIDTEPYAAYPTYYNVFAYQKNAGGLHIIDGSVSFPGALPKLPTLKGLTAVAKGLRTIELNWTPVAGAQSYLVYAQREGVRRYIGTTTNTIFTDQSAIYEEYNYYWVYPYNIKNEVKQLGDCEKYIYIKGNLPPVTGLKAASVKGGVKLTWDAVKDSEGYLVYGIVDGKPYGYVGMTRLGTTFTDRNASKSVYNYYWVFPYYTNKAGKMIPGPVLKYTYGRAL